jgi:hypothetical protein
MCCAVVLCQVPWNIGGRCGDRKEFATGKFPITTTVVLDFITGAPEVRTFMKDHSIGPESEADQSSNVPTSRFFRGIESLTLAQVPDYMAKTFRGLWVFKKCPGHQ